MKALLFVLLLAQRVPQGGPLPPGAPALPKPQVEAPQGTQNATEPAVERNTPEPQSPKLQPAASKTRQPVPPGGGGWQMLIFLVAMVLVFWLLIMRPQRKQQKKQEEFLASLKAGDKVVTSGGVVGVVSAIEGNLVALEVAKGVRLRLLKQYVASRYMEQGEASKTKKGK